MKSAFHRVGCCLCLWLFISGCQRLDVFRFQNSEKEKENLFEEQEVTVDYIGDKAQVVGNSAMVLYGIGLVTRLDNTGEDPPPSNYRTVLMREMSRRGVTNPQQILADPSTALVLVTGYLSADVKKGGHFDVQVQLPPGSQATSLAGGWLMETYLWEKATAPTGQELTGRAYATASGPILLSITDEKEAKTSAMLIRGKVLGGGVAKIDRDLGIFIRSDFKGARNSKRIADRIGERFHDHSDRGIKVSMAKAKDDQFIELKVHPYYKNNYPRYMEVIRKIVFKESLVEQRDRLDKLRDQLNNPDTSALAAIRMEAIGAEAIPFLKTGLNSASKEVRFYAAEALAYMKDESGVEILADCAKTERAFRAYAYAALASLDSPSCYTQLRSLLEDETPETRYGAFRALWTCNPQDPSIPGWRINEEFNFHPVPLKGEPMVHLSRNRVAEVVLFGTDQRLSPPLALTAGNKIAINASPGSETVTISKFEYGEKDERLVVENNLAKVIVEVSKLGATYPDVAAMLIQAKSQHNLECRLEVDALPGTGRLYYRTKEEQDLASARGGRSKEKTTIGRVGLSPTIFGSKDEDVKDEKADPYADQSSETVEEDPAETVESDSAGEASSTDIRQTSAEEIAESPEESSPEKGIGTKLRKLNFLRSKKESGTE